MPALLAPALSLYACLDDASPEHAETVSSLLADVPIERWEALTPLPGKPGRAAVLTAIADVYLDQDRHLEAEGLLRDAVDGWLQEGHIPGELCARRLLAVAESRKRAFHNALATVSLAEARARDTGVTAQLNRLVYVKIRLLLILNERLEEALLQLERHPPGEDGLERLIWTDTRALLLSRLGRWRQTVAEYDRAIKLAVELGEEDMRTAAVANRARAMLELAQTHPASIDTELLVSETEQVIQDPASPPEVRLMAILFLTYLQPLDTLSERLEDCHLTGLDAGLLNLAGACLAQLALLKSRDDPGQATRLMGQAVALADKGGTARDRQRLAWSRIRLAWELNPPLEAMHRSLDHLGLTKALREQQTGGEARARLLAYWSYADRLVAGLAYHHADDYPELLNPALAVLERARAPVLQELRKDTSNPDEAAHFAARRISEIQSDLLEAPEDPENLEILRHQLRRLDLEYREASLREPETVPDPGAPPELETLQTALAPDEALLSALTNTELWETQDTGWMHVITRDQSFAVRVPGHLSLARWNRALAGMENWSAPHAQRTLEAAGKALMAPILDRLPDRVQRLILVPDIGLHDLPIAALTLPGGQPLGTRFELDIIPSAGLWLELRESPKARGGALVFADPDLPAGGYQRLDPVFEADLEPLPGARAEARRIRARLGTGAEVLLGDAASEGALVAADLERHALLHFGTHTLIHPTVAHRSAILLASSNRETDGLLQPREILELNLNGRAAILAVCTGAGGEWVDGEGLLSLARAFVGAGAVAVVASQWPVDDGHAQVFFDRMYRQLARGRELSSALHHAGRELFEAGYPSEAWAGYVLIGDGAWSPVEEVRPWRGLAWLVAGVLLFLSVAVREVVRRRR